MTGPAQAGYELTWAGWLIMILSVGFVTGLLLWSVARVLRESRADKLRSRIDIEPPDDRRE